MKKHLKKLIAKVSLLSLLSLSPVSRATNVSDVTPIQDPFVEFEQHIRESGDKGEHSCGCKVWEKPGDRFNAGFQRAFYGTVSLIMLSVGSFITFVPNKEDFQVSIPSRIAGGLFGCLGAVGSFVFFKDLYNIIKGVPLMHILNDEEKFRLALKNGNLCSGNV